VLHGADAVSRGAILASSRAEGSALALVDGAVGVVFAPGGRPQIVLAFTVSADGRVAAIDVVADPDRLCRLRLAPLPDISR
jgi:RNA polymerase sigma-70 factor (ECF subfamily)